MSHPALSDTSGHAEPFDTDVLIVGAGPSGLTLAAASAAKGVRTVVIDRLPKAPTPRGPPSCMPER